MGVRSISNVKTRRLFTFIEESVFKFITFTKSLHNAFSICTAVIHSIGTSKFSSLNSKLNKHLWQWESVISNEDL